MSCCGGGSAAAAGEVVAFGTGIDDTHDDDPEHDDDAGCYSPGLTNCGGHRWIALCVPSRVSSLRAAARYFSSWCRALLLSATREFSSIALRRRSIGRRRPMARAAGGG